MQKQLTSSSSSPLVLAQRQQQLVHDPSTWCIPLLSLITVLFSLLVCLLAVAVQFFMSA
jgi:hypothetical protein